MYTGIIPNFLPLAKAVLYKWCLHLRPIYAYTRYDSVYMYTFIYILQKKTTETRIVMHMHHIVCFSGSWMGWGIIWMDVTYQKKHGSKSINYIIFHDCVILDIYLLCSASLGFHFLYLHRITCMIYPNVHTSFCTEIQIWGEARVYISWRRQICTLVRQKTLVLKWASHMIPNVSICGGALGRLPLARLPGT